MLGLGLDHKTKTFGLDLEAQILGLAIQVLGLAVPGLGLVVLLTSLHSVYTMYTCIQ